MLTKVKMCDGFIYIDLNKVFVVREYPGKRTAILTRDKGNVFIIDEPLKRVVKRLKKAMRR